MTQTTDNLRNWLVLTHAPGLGPATFHRLLAQRQDPTVILESGLSFWQQTGLSKEAIAFLQAPDWQQIEVDLKWAEQERAAIITLEDTAYPDLLREIADPPPVLYIFGDWKLLQSPQLAIVGSRNPTHAGLETAEEFAKYLAQIGLTITSGMALGIDAAAHQGALKGKGHTVAVVGTGLDRVYPSRHKQLAHAIAEQGVLVSEFPIGTPPLPSNFPRRNRIISGLSMGVLVVEAARQSGSLITARMALEQGREVFAVPGSIHHPLAKGCNELIRQGAKLVEKAEHILEELAGFAGMVQPVASELNSEQSLELDEEYQKVLQSVDYAPTSVDKVVERSGLTADTVCSMLLVLELQGFIQALSGGFYSKQ